MPRHTGPFDVNGLHMLNVYPDPGYGTTQVWCACKRDEDKLAEAQAAYDLEYPNG